jgi:hypothetical protein
MDLLQVSQGYSAGNYANAYEGTDLEAAISRLSPNRSAEYIAAFTLGFLATYMLKEMGPDGVEAFQEAYFSNVGKVCLAAGYLEEVEESEWDAVYGCLEDEDH